MQTSVPTLLMILVAGINGMIAFQMESWAGHDLEAEMGEFAVHLFHMSAKYQMWSCAALVGIGILYDLWTDFLSRVVLGGAGLAFAVSTAVFCGATYYVPFGGPFEPVIYGAIGLSIAWSLLIAAPVIRFFRR